MSLGVGLRFQILMPHCFLPASCWGLSPQLLSQPLQPDASFLIMDSQLLEMNAQIKPCDESLSFLV